jgi:uncharacterized protein YodC (DUF2158 family)
MEKAEAKEGLQVQLNSGGPKMTIESLNEINCKCLWFVGNDCHERNFAYSVLKPVPQDSRIRISSIKSSNRY